MNWYVIQAKPQKEDFLCQQLRVRGIEVYFPCIRVKPVNPRARKMKPYFPGYMFFQMDLSRISPSALRWVPGAVGIVSFGGEPAPISESLIGLLQKRLEELDGAKENPDDLRQGAPVVIQDGPFAGYEAIFDFRLSGTDRVRVLLSLLCNRQIPLEVPAGYIRRINQH